MSSGRVFSQPASSTSIFYCHVDSPTVKVGGAAVQQQAQHSIARTKPGRPLDSNVKPSGQEHGHSSKGADLKPSDVSSGSVCLALSLFRARRPRHVQRAAFEKRGPASSLFKLMFHCPDPKA